MSEKHVLGVGHRLSSAPTGHMVQALGSEVRYAAYVADGLSLADMAHVVMLKECGIIPSHDAVALLTVLLDLHDEKEAVCALGHAEGDIYDHRDGALKARAGAVSGWLHTARARREAITLGWVLGLRRQISQWQRSLSQCLQAIDSVCRRSTTLLMPDFTYLQHAHPTTLAHYLSGFAFPLLRDLERLSDLQKTLNASPAGAVSTNGTRLPINRQRVSELLGFSSILAHDRDAMWQPDVVIQAMSLAVSVNVTIDRLVEELFVWATHEFSFFELADAHCRTSVIMPQKKNPYALAHMRGRARELSGRWVSVVSTNMTPSGQVDNRTAAYSLLPQSITDTISSLDLLAEVLLFGTFNAERMADMASEGSVWGTELAEFLVETEMMDARRAHSLVGRFVAHLPDNVTFEGLESHFRDVYQQSTGTPWCGDRHALAAVFDPRAIVQARKGAGGCGVAQVIAMLDELQEALRRCNVAIDENERHAECGDNVLNTVKEIIHAEQ